MNTEYRPRFQGKIDIIAALVGALLGVVISCLNLVYPCTSFITLGPLLIIVCLVYLVFRRKLLTSTSEPLVSHRLVLMINIIFWLSLASSIYSLSTEILHRPLIYFILISIAASMIALQILYSGQKNTTYLILFEILLVSLSVRASAFWVFPTLPGSDSWAHMEYIRAFVNQGNIPQSMPEPIGGDYLYYPLSHLNITAVKLMTGLNYKAAMFFGAGLPLILSTIFVFLIGRNLVDRKIGLLAALLINLADCHLMWSISIIAMSFGISLYTMILYLFLRDKGNIKISTTSLVIVLLFVLILTHTVSSFIMLCFILSFLIGMYAYRFLHIKQGAPKRSMVTPTLMGMFVVGMLAYWIYAGYTEGGSFFDIIAKTLYRSLTTEAAFLARAPVAPGLDPALNISGFLILVLFGILGCLLWLTQRQEGRTKVSFIATLIVLFAITFLFPLFGLKNILPGRWYPFIYLVLSVAAATAILTVIYRIGFSKLGNIILVCIVFAFSFFMITNDNSNMDSPIYASEFNSRLVYTNSEMLVGEWVTEAYDGKIITDAQYGDCVIRVYFSRPYSVSFEMLDEEQLNSGLVIWRDVMADRPIRVPSGYVVLGGAFEPKLEASHNLVYTNNTSKAFLARGT